MSGADLGFGVLGLQKLFGFGFSGLSKLYLVAFSLPYHKSQAGS